MFWGYLPLTDHSFVVSGASQGPLQAIITAYSELDSCHYPTKGGCLTASGTIASETTIACPRSWPLGTKVLIEGKEYICEDRYNANLSDRLDVWAGYGVEGYEKAKNFGIKNMEIVIK